MGLRSAKRRPFLMGSGANILTVSLVTVTSVTGLSRACITYSQEGIKQNGLFDRDQGEENGNITRLRKLLSKDKPRTWEERFCPEAMHQTE